MGERRNGGHGPDGHGQGPGGDGPDERALWLGAWSASGSIAAALSAAGPGEHAAADVLARKMMASCADAPLQVGYIHEVFAHAVYGMAGAAFPVTWFSAEGEPESKVLWVPGATLDPVRAVASKLLSPEFTRALVRVGLGRQ
ncbi:hypothetical protein ABT299_35005 [Spirillospora sp. NPDC000708]